MQYQLKQPVSGLKEGETFRFAHLKRVGNGVELRFERDSCVLVMNKAEDVAKALLIGLGFDPKQVEGLVIPAGSSTIANNWLEIFSRIIQAEGFPTGSDFQTLTKDRKYQEAVNSGAKTIEEFVVAESIEKFFNLKLQQLKTIETKENLPNHWFALAAVCIFAGLNNLEELPLFVIP
jgi:hypothetical protein